MTAVRTEVGHWALVPSWVRKILRGQSRALELYVLLADVANHGDNVAQRRRGWLAKELDCSPDTVDRAMAVLVRVGAVSVERRYDGDGANLASNYLVHQVPPPEVAESPGRTDAARVEPVETEKQSEGDGRAGAARGPHGRGEVAAEMPRGRRGDAAYKDQPPSYQPPSFQPPPPAVASDVGAEAREEQAPRRKRKPREEPCHPNYHAAFDVVTAAFGLPRDGNSDPTRGKVNRLRKAVHPMGLLDDLDHLADLIWLYRGQPSGTPDIGTFPSAADRLRSEQAHLIEHRSEAAALVASACADLGIGPEGRADSQPRAEVAVATLLHARTAPVALAAALRASQGWGTGHLRTALSQAQRPLTVVGSFSAPEDLGGTLALDLVSLLQRPLSAEDVGRVGAELVTRIEKLNPRQRSILLDVIRKGTFDHPTNGAGAFVAELIRALAPVDPERDAANARDLAAWGATPTHPEPLALPGGTPR